MFMATFQFGHFHFFGLAQVRESFRTAQRKPSGITVRYLYALVRHPISLGWMMIPLITPHLTVGHIAFSAASIIYILVATPFEETDLVEELGEAYFSYRNRVPAFIPLLKIEPNHQPNEQ